MYLVKLLVLSILLRFYIFLHRCLKISLYEICNTPSNPCPHILLLPSPKDTQAPYSAVFPNRCTPTEVVFNEPVCVREVRCSADGTVFVMDTGVIFACGRYVKQTLFLNRKPINPCGFPAYDSCVYPLSCFKGLHSIFQILWIRFRISNLMNNLIFYFRNDCNKIRLNPRQGFLQQLKLSRASKVETRSLLF